MASAIDWLFQQAARELAAEAALRAQQLSAKAAVQRAPFADRGFPEPGQDPELVSLLRVALGKALGAEPSAVQWSSLVQQVREYMALENKRKNLLGEGFEDVLGSVIKRTCDGEFAPQVRVRALLHELPGFNRQRAGDKPNKVDVAILGRRKRTLVTAKWSLRADREKQFSADFADYTAAESDRKQFDYVFVTNEFDPARLKRACESLAHNSPLFTNVVHINPEALRATYAEALSRTVDDQKNTMKSVLQHVDSGRLISLGDWLSRVGADG